jgi:hypothetical protein
MRLFILILYIYELLYGISKFILKIVMLLEYMRMYYNYYNKLL